MRLKNGGVIAASIVLIAASIACDGEKTAVPAAPAVATVELAVATVELAVAPTPTLLPEPTATSDPCIPWNQVTAAMKGKVVCMRGLITKFDQSRSVGTRYSFSDKSGTFFLFSAKYEITNPNTGKTIAPGTCVEVTGPIDVQSGTPFINLDKLVESGTLSGFNFYEGTSACE
jgi:uncharacterized protein YdeI (BOF family)